MSEMKENVSNKPREAEALSAILTPQQRETLIKESRRLWAEFDRQIAIPAVQNFNINAQESNGESSIVLKNRTTGETIDLGSYLPKNYRFIKSDEFAGYIGNNGRVLFDQKLIRGRGFLLALFHEIGHTNREHMHEVPLHAEFIAAIHSKIRAPLTPLEERALPDWYFDLLEKSKAGSERDAWAYALNALREIEKKGFDVFAGFNNAQEIQNFIALMLQTYDISVLLDASENPRDNRLQVGKIRFAKSRPSPRDIISNLD